MRMIAVAGAMVLAALAGAAMAQEVLQAREARGQLFNPRGNEVVIVPHAFLTETEVAVLRQVVADNVPYYGAMAVSPDDGVGHESVTARGNYHDVPAAAAAALADCDAKRTGATPCVIVAEVRPRRWEPRALQLSQGATATFRRLYGGSGDRALAASPSTGAFAMRRGAGAGPAAVAECNAAAGTTDCRVVIAD